VLGKISTWPLALASVIVALGADASARPMDPDLGRLVIDPGCVTGEGPVCAADRSLFTKLVSQLGFALAPHPVHEARSSGLSGFEVSLEASLTGIDSAADYWQRGTRGSGGSAEPSPDDYLQLYALELRKGFGFGVEAAASLGVMPHTSLLSWGGDLRVALLEGMRHGLWRYLPDTSVGASFRQATGLGELALGTFALDARFSRPFPSPAGFIVTPWLGYQWVRIDADSQQVDLTPGVGALESCGYAGSNVPGGPDAPEAAGAAAVSGAPAGTLDGSPLCRASGADLANSVSFGAADVQRHRVLVGASYRREFLKVGAQIVTDLVRPDAAQTDGGIARALRCDVGGGNCRPSPRQWTVVLELGASF
jgi:hypothetical protein